MMSQMRKFILKRPLKLFDYFSSLLKLKYKEYKAVFELLLQKVVVNSIYYEIYHVDWVVPHRKGFKGGL